MNYIKKFIKILFVITISIPISIIAYVSVAMGIDTLKKHFLH